MFYWIQRKENVIGTLFIAMYMDDQNIIYEYIRLCPSVCLSKYMCPSDCIPTSLLSVLCGMLNSNVCQHISQFIIRRLCYQQAKTSCAHFVVPSVCTAISLP